MNKPNPILIVDRQQKTFLPISRMEKFNMKEPKGLYLCKAGDKNWGLYLINESAQNYFALKSAVYNMFNDCNLNPFIQSDSDPFHKKWEQEELEEKGKGFCHDFLFIEFWTDNEELILNKSIEFATSINMELKVEDF